MRASPELDPVRPMALHVGFLHPAGLADSMLVHGGLGSKLPSAIWGASGAGAKKMRLQ